MVSARLRKYFVEVPAHFPCLDQGAEEMREHLRVLCTRGRERGTMLQILPDGLEYLRKGGIFDLGRQDPEGADHRQTGVDHRRELTGDDCHLAQLDPIGEEGDLDLCLEIDRGLRRDRDGHVAHLAKTPDDQRHAVAFELPFDQPTGSVPDFVVKCQCHGAPFRCSLVQPAPVLRWFRRSSSFADRS